MSPPTIRAALDAAEQHATFKIWAGHPLAIILEGLVKKIRTALNAEAPPTMELGALFDRHCFEDDYGNKNMNAEEFESAALELAARTALDAEPAGEGPSERIVSIAKAVQECAFAHESDARLIGNVCAEDVADLCDAVIDRWGHPAAPAAPEPGEVEELVAWLRTIKSVQAQKAAALLEQRTAPAPAVVPVAVAERPWEREGWCDEQGRCWFLSSRFFTWSLESPPVALTRGVGRFLSLPHHAIPLPQAGEGE